MSERNFARAFRDETGMTPAAYVEVARVERARRALETTDLPVEAVAARCGFGTVETMRRAFAPARRRQPGRLPRALPPPPEQKEPAMDIAIPLFDRFTALDAIGPYEVLQPPARRARDVRRRRARAGHAPTTACCASSPSAALDDVPSPDILVVPGGIGTRAMMNDDAAARLGPRARTRRRSGPRSVCTGSLLLGAAGLLDGLEATTHWAAMDTLARLGAQPDRRARRRAGQDHHRRRRLGGHRHGARRSPRAIAGDDVAQAIQLGIEYDPQPPFDAGSPEKAPAEVVALCRTAEALIDAGQSSEIATTISHDRNAA